jgi:hypothetical protein
VAQNIFAFTAGGKAARDHLAVSITDPFSFELLKSIVESKDANALRQLEVTEGGLYAWGAVHGPMNDIHYAKMQVGDFVVCVYEARCRYVAKVKYKLESEALARLLWGDAEEGETWQHMFFLSRPQPINVHLSQLNGFMPSRFGGFARIGDDFKKKISDRFNSLEKFVKIKLLASVPLESLLQQETQGYVDQAPHHSDSPVHDAIDTDTNSEPEELCLIGTEKDKNWAVVPMSQIEASGHWAVWWSFKLQPEAAEKLPQVFHVYLSAGPRKITHRLVCSKFAESKSSSGMVSPWPRHTIPSERNLTRTGTKKSGIFKTWLLVDKIEELEPALDINDFEPARPWTKSQSSLLNQNTFGYAHLKRTPTVKHEGFTAADATSELFMAPADFDKALRLLSSKKNLILQGSPGVGKTFVAKRLAYALIGRKSKESVETVQFHQAYSYEDFIQGFRPKKDESGFAIQNGVFHRFCERAADSPDDKFVFIIDEINRGNLAKIFGELLMLIEADKRSHEWGLRLAYADKKDERFYVPDNVYVVGMMNTADRSLTSIDYALRRRFAFMRVKPGFGHDNFIAHLKKRGWSPEIASHIDEKFIALNETITKDEELREGFCVGHSYFCGTRPDGMSDKAYLAEIIDTEIRPLLEDYWFDKKPEVINAIVEQLDAT